MYCIAHVSAALLTLLLAAAAPGAAQDGPETEIPAVTLPVVKSMDERSVRPHTGRVVVTIAESEGNKRYHWNTEGPLGITELKKRLAAFAKTRIDAKTGRPNVRLVIAADARLGFTVVHHLMRVATAPDVGIRRIDFEVERRVDEKTVKRGRIPAYRPTGEEASSTIHIQLMTRRKKCVCFVDGRAVGLLPDHASKLAALLARLHDGADDTVVKISPDPRARHQEVVTLLETCRRKNIGRIVFVSGGLPPRKQS